MAAYQAPLSLGFSRQEHWNGLLFPPPGDLPNPGIKPTCPALAGGFFTTGLPRSPNEWLNNLNFFILCWLWIFAFVCLFPNKTWPTLFHIITDMYHISRRTLNSLETPATSISWRKRWVVLDLPSKQVHRYVSQRMFNEALPQTLERKPFGKYFYQRPNYLPFFHWKSNRS